jgi:hypothetical protein
MREEFESVVLGMAVAGNLVECDNLVAEFLQQRRQLAQFGTRLVWFASAPFPEGFWPVRSAALLRAQAGELTNACLKSSPAFATRVMCDVRMSRALRGASPIAPWSSEGKTTK